MSKDAPLYPKLLRLRHIAPNAWQRALLGEGVLGVSALLVLADLASAWALLVLPLAVAAVVKGHDLLAGVLRGPVPATPEPVAPARAGRGAAALRSAVLRARSGPSAQDGAGERADHEPVREPGAMPGRFTRRGLRRRTDDEV